MGSEHIVPVDVVCVCPTPSRMVSWESQRIKVLSDSNRRREVVVSGKGGRRLEGFCALETRFDDLAGQA